MRKSSTYKAQLLQQANVAMSSQAWENAVHIWEEILREYGRKAPVEAFHKLTVAYKRLERYDEAQAIAKLGLKRHKDNLDLSIEYAEILMAQGLWAEASVKWQRIIDSMGKDAPEKAWLKLVRCLRATKDEVKAEHILRKGLLEYPQGIELRSEAIKFYTQTENWKKVVAFSKSDSGGQYVFKFPAEVWVRIIEAHVALEDPNGARTAARNAVEANSDHPKLILAVSRLLTAQADWQKALESWERLLSLTTNPEMTALRQEARLNVSTIKRIVDLPDYKQAIKRYQEARVAYPKHKKIAIITSVTKGYDDLKPHEYLDPRFDFKVYTDADFDDLGIYEVLPLPNLDLDNSRIIRFAKTHPHVLAKGYSAAVWLDTSLMLTGDIYPILEKFLASGKPIGSILHPHRKSIYEEFEVCVTLNKDNPEIMKRQMDFYKSEHYDTKLLTENGFLAFNLRHEKLAPALEKWWQQITMFSKRDQLSFNYSMDISGAEVFHLSSPPHDVRNHDDFIIAPHGTPQIALHTLNAMIIS